MASTITLAKDINKEEEKTFNVGDLVSMSGSPIISVISKVADNGMYELLTLEMSEVHDDVILITDLATADLLVQHTEYEINYNGMLYNYVQALRAGMPVHTYFRGKVISEVVLDTVEAANDI